MSEGDSLKQRKKILEEALSVTNEYEKAIKRIKELEKLVNGSDNKGKQQVSTENAKLLELNKSLKTSLAEVQNRCKAAENEIKQVLEKQSVLKAEIYKKDQALAKYKMRMTNEHPKTDENDPKELELQMQEKNKLIEVLKAELMEKERLFVGADTWNRKCSKEKSNLTEEIKKLKESHGSTDAFARILSLEDIITDREKQLQKAKEINEQLAVHVYGLEAKNSEIPKLENKIRMLEMELGNYKKKNANSYDSLFSMPPPPISPSHIPHSYNYPPPPIGRKSAEPAKMPFHFTDLEKQMANMASEIARLKHQHSTGSN